MTARDVIWLAIRCNLAEEDLSEGLQQHKVIFVFGKILLHAKTLTFKYTQYSAIFLFKVRNTFTYVIFIQDTS